jgi:1-acyl-sn-glycerol-3-phosphate acyltransferase
MAVEKSKDRLEVLARIDEYEKNQWWSKDVEDDPPTRQLQPGEVDFARRKLSSKIKTHFANKAGWKFIQGLIKSGAMIMDEPEGIENYEAVKDRGLIMTCNHFNPFDNFAVLVTIDKYLKHHVMWKVIREGNYTNFPGFYGYLFRQCNTLPFSSNYSVTKEFFEGIKYLMKKKQKLLVYAEQGMWWNYRKPRPLTAGAARFAIENNVPLLPMFITMRDSDKIGDDGFPIQIYKVHILPALYADPNKSKKQNIEWLREKNYEMWKEVYEKTYGIPLTYLQQEDN